LRRRMNAAPCIRHTGELYNTDRMTFMCHKGTCLENYLRPEKEWRVSASVSENPINSSLSVYKPDFVICICGLFNNCRRFSSSCPQRSPLLPLYRLSSPVSAGLVCTSPLVHVLPLFLAHLVSCVLLVWPNSMNCRFCTSSMMFFCIFIISLIVSFRILSNLVLFQLLHRLLAVCSFSSLPPNTP
jgi:hypothetical protein